MTSHSETTTELRTCRECACQFEIDTDPMFARFHLCDDCEQKQAENEERRAREKRALSSWEATVPKVYRETKQDHPDFPRSVHVACRSWLAGEGIGGNDRQLFLGLIGESGRCKTRVISQLVKLLIWRGESVIWVNSSRWQWDVQHLHDDSEKIDAAKRVKMAMEAPWLVFDDLGSLKSTETVCDNLYALLEARTANELPMLWTSNETVGEMLAGKGLTEKARKRNLSRLAGFSNILEL